LTHILAEGTFLVTHPHFGRNKMLGVLFAGFKKQDKHHNAKRPFSGLREEEDTSQPELRMVQRRKR